MEVANLTVYLHIGNGGIFKFSITYIFFVLRLFCVRQITVVNLLFQLRRQLYGTRLAPAKGFCVQHLQSGCCAFGCTINFTKRCAICLDIKFVDFRIPLLRTRRNNVIYIIDNLTAFFAHENVVQLQIGV